MGFVVVVAIQLLITLGNVVWWLATGCRTNYARPWGVEIDMMEEEHKQTILKNPMRATTTTTTQLGLRTKTRGRSGQEA